ncbi:hypothetical protein H2200_011291 [Cladophialophora chaetospira]|uniref:Uncharacterized protein n=1 Tax=Cladophialophora chaetospira TaxID=386627 RepID=A0AA38X0D2_9EURO|nr:hypothetical protein H2200_011291 [Cladophialophora chaetospira]
MANNPRPPPSNYPPSMGPGARPIGPDDAVNSRTKLMEVMQARSKYQVSVEDETLSLSYELNASPRLYRLSFDAMPLQGFSRWWLYGGPARARRAGVLAIDIIRGSEDMAQRPVGQQEAEALTYWTSRRLLYGSYTTVICCALGSYLARRRNGHVKMKFPIMAAKPLEQYNHFPLRQVPILTGRPAQFAWQFSRYTIWFQLAFLITSPIVGAVAAVRVARGMATDSRTQQLVHDLKERGKNGLSGIEFPRQQSSSRPDSRTQPQPGGQELDSSFNQDFRDPERGGGVDQAAARGQNIQQAIDDAIQGRSTFEQGSGGDTGMLSDSAVKDRESRPQYERYPTSQQQQPPQPQVQSTRSSTSADSDPFFYDDASPTAGNDADNASPTAYSGPSGGSVWDRIRGGSSTPKPQQSSSRARSRQAEADAESAERNSFNSEARPGSGALQDGRDRRQAQREFDEMLEKERQQSGSGEYDRGMKAVEMGEERRDSSGGGGGESAWERRRRGGE